MTIISNFLNEHFVSMPGYDQHYFR